MVRSDLPIHRAAPVMVECVQSSSSADSSQPELNITRSLSSAATSQGDEHNSSGHQASTVSTQSGQRCPSGHSDAGQKRGGRADLARAFGRRLSSAAGTLAQHVASSPTGSTAVSVLDRSLDLLQKTTLWLAEPTKRRAERPLPDLVVLPVLLFVNVVAKILEVFGSLTGFNLPSVDDIEKTIRKCRLSLRELDRNRSCKRAEKRKRCESSSRLSSNLDRMDPCSPNGINADTHYFGTSPGKTLSDVDSTSISSIQSLSSEAQLQGRHGSMRTLAGDNSPSAEQSSDEDNTLDTVIMSTPKTGTLVDDTMYYSPISEPIIQQESSDDGKMSNGSASPEVMSAEQAALGVVNPEPTSQSSASESLLQAEKQSSSFFSLFRLKRN